MTLVSAPERIVLQGLSRSKWDLDVLLMHFDMKVQECLDVRGCISALVSMIQAHILQQSPITIDHERLPSDLFFALLERDSNRLGGEDRDLLYLCALNTANVLGLTDHPAVWRRLLELHPDKEFRDQAL